MAGLLGVLAIAILFRSIYHIAARSFYAQQDTKTPLYISIVAITLNIGLAIWFTFSLHLGAYGLAVAQAIVAFVEVVILFVVMEWRIKGVFNAEFWSAILRMASAGGFMSVVTYWLVTSFPLHLTDKSFFSSLPKFILIVIGSFSVYVILCHMMKLRETKPVLDRIRYFFFKM